uniref:NADH-ubiquinone oxidoreductase chain 2 n=1 Tax=Pediculus humanus capitis TaxID=121226 RepID=I7D3B6_9NEOP|nr:NADH dehydrogenase subunit 2 [Pediculus humanus capitis]AHF70570.1 NADH dehydrogenase subunit 2 [Pediculus humanus capitis]
MFLFSCLFSVSSMSWWPAWLGLEFSVIWFFPLMNLEFMKSSKSSVWLMFSLSCLSSMGLLLSLFILKYLVEFNSSVNSWLMMSFLFLSMKMGLPPFHNWYLDVGDSLDSWSFMVLMTAFKVPSLVFLMNTFLTLSNLSLILMLYALYALYASMAGIFSYSMRRMLIYSSILNVVWSLVSLFYSLSLFLTFYCIYFNSFCVFWFLKEWNSLKRFEETILANREALILGLSLANLAGMPPLSMFFMKMKIISSVMMDSQVSLIVLTTASLISTTLMLWIYMSIFYSSTLWKVNSFYYTKSVNFSLLKMSIWVISFSLVSVGIALTFM